MRSSNIPKSELERMYVEEGMPQWKIGKILGVSQGTIKNWLRRHNISTRRTVPIPSDEVITKMYTHYGMDQYQIGEHFGVHMSTVAGWMRRMNIPTRGTRGTIGIFIPEKEVLERMYTYERMTQKEIADEFDVHPSAVYRWFRRYDIPTRTHNGTIGLFVPEKIDIEKLINEGLNQHQIAESYGVCDATVFSWCEQLGIPGMVNGYRFRTPEYRNWRRNVFQRDHHTCQMCGATKTYIQAHHIVPYCDHPELGYEPDNGITLCKRCHEQTFKCEYDYIQQFAAITQPHLRDHDIIESMPWEPPLETNSIIDY